MGYSWFTVSLVSVYSKVVQLYIPSSGLGIPADWKWEDGKKYSMPVEIKRASARVAIHISDKKGSIDSEEFSSFFLLENNEKKKQQLLMSDYQLKVSAK